MEIFKWKDNTFSFQISRKSYSAMNFEVNSFENAKYTYGYFNFNGNSIFVWTNGSIYDFFKKTDSFQKFDFIYSSSNTKAPADDIHYSIIHYKNSNGQFSPEGPPLVKGNDQ